MTTQGMGSRGRAVTLTCDHCGTTFQRYKSNIKKKPGKMYCSATCRQLHRRRELIPNDDGTVSVPLTDGYVSIIDSEDAEKVSKYTWHKTNTGYAAARIKGRMVLLHRYIMEPPADLDIDHINGDRLYNRRSNLRTATNAENIRNQAGQRTRRSSIYKGVTRNGRNYSASIMVDYKDIYLGTFPTQEDAAKAYNEAALVHHGEFARLNQIKGGTQ